MYVIKRDGSQQPVHFDKITERIKKAALLDGHQRLNINHCWIAQKVIEGLHNGVRTSAIDDLSAQTAASLLTTHPDYGELAARIAISKLHKSVPSTFSMNVEKQLQHKLIDPKFRFIFEDKEKRDKIDNAIVAERDYNLDYFAIQTLTDRYLLRHNEAILERPQHLFMRVALGIHFDDIPSVLQSYHLMSQNYFTHAAPTLSHAAAPEAQLSSSFVLTMKENSIEGIYDTIKQTAVLSQNASDIALSLHNIQCKGSIVPMLRVMNETARFLEQESFAIYLEPWHADIFDYLQLKKHGKEEDKLLYCLWVNDLFMQRVMEDAQWSLMSSDKCKGLHLVSGQKFNELYTEYESKKMYESQVKARELWSEILHTQMVTGMPFIMYKDSCNRKSNQSHLGTIQSANATAGIVQYCDSDEIAVCNLASISLPRFVDKEKQIFDFEQLLYVTGIITENLNKIIDINYYPLDECRRSNLRHRPIGIGVQGLADVFMLMRMPFDSAKAKQLNKKIFESIYYAAVKKSNELAMKHGAYETFKGSPASKGILQFDSWDNVDTHYNWEKLKKSIHVYGLRNSLLTAPAPMINEDTSQILGNNKGFEPYATNLSVCEIAAGEFAVINKHLLHDLIALDLWNDRVKNKLLVNKGSVQFIDEIPNDLKAIYKTAWEIKQREVINMAAVRGPFVDQSQSMEVFLEEISYGKLTSMYFYGWQNGLKTGVYRLRTKLAEDSIKFNIFGNLIPKDVEVISPRKKQRKTETQRKEIKPVKKIELELNSDQKDEEELDDKKVLRYRLDDDRKEEEEEEESNKMLGNKLGDKLGGDDDQKDSLLCGS